MGLRTSEQRREAALGKRICKVAVTGGGCAGKTTFMRVAKETAETRGWTVLTIPEVPTLVMESGIKPNGRTPFREFERTILRLQIAWEEAFEDAAEAMDGQEPVLILCDRGMPEIAAYMEEEQYEQLLAEANLTPESARETYDMAIHLVSVVDGAPHLYTMENNEHRYETAEVALRQEMRIRECWGEYGRRRIIEANPDSFEAKMEEARGVLITLLDGDMT